MKTRVVKAALAAAALSGITATADAEGCLVSGDTARRPSSVATSAESPVTLTFFREGFAAFDAEGAGALDARFSCVVDALPIWMRLTRLGLAIIFR